MSNWLTNEINKFLSPNETVLDLCCGNGNVSDGFLHSSILGVDACQEYLNVYKNNVSNSSTILFDLSKISDSKENFFSDHLYDNVLCIDGVEHLEKSSGESLIHKMERMAKKRVIIFTPENAQNPNIPTLNNPKNTFGTFSGDEWQIHRSAFPRSFFAERGYKIIQLNKARNVYDNSYYYEMLYILEK